MERFILCPFRSLLLVSVLAALPVVGQLARTPESEIKAFNQELMARRTDSSDASKARVGQLIQTRLALLAELVQSDPAAALRMALPEDVLEPLRSILGDRAATDLENWGEWSGSLAVIVEDDFERGFSRTLTALHVAGQTYQVYFAGLPQRIVTGATMRVKGIQLGGRIAVSESNLVAAATSLGCNTNGPQKIAFLLVNFASSQIPQTVTASSLKTIVSGSGHSLDGSWRETSGGTVTATSDVYGPFNLGADYSDDQLAQIQDAAIKAAASVVTFQNYNHVVIVMPPGFPTGGGHGSLGCYTMSYPSTGSFDSGMIWLRSDFVAPNDLGVCAMGHEGGHNLGLDHSSSESYGSVPLGAIGAVPTHDEYGDRFAMMGLCYTYNTTTLLGHYASPHKVKLGWLGASNYQEVTSTGTFTIKPAESGAVGLQALHVQRGTANNDWLWIEYRQPVGYDATLAGSGFINANQVFSGALIHYEDPTVYPAYTRLLNFSATVLPNNFTQPALPVGSSWSDPYSQLTLKVNSATSAGLNVSATYDTPCASVTPQSRSYTSAGAVSSDTFTVIAAGNCAWVAGSNSSWITVNSGLSGSGNGTVSYSVAANTGISPRTGGIAIGRQTVAITQGGTDAQPMPISVTPTASSSIAGALQMFSFLASDGDGAHDLTRIDMQFGASTKTALSCYLYYRSADGQVFLHDDTGPIGAAYSGFPGENRVLANSQCKVDLGVTSVAYSGNTVTFNVGVNFLTTYVGAKNVYLQAFDLPGADSGVIKVGTWTVTPGFGITGQSTLSGSGLSGVTIALSGSQSATATTDAAGNYILSGLAAGGNYTVTPSFSGFSRYTFAPASQTFNNLSGAQITNFTATLVTYPISGQVTVAGAPLSGVTMALSGAQSGTTITDNSGNYSFNGLVPVGSFTIVPSLANYTFAPPSQSFSTLSGPQTANFAATLITYRISGQVNVTGVPRGGVTIALTGSQTGTATTDTSGTYSFSSLPAWGRYTITPSLTGYAISPASLTFNNLSNNQTASFNATQITYGISGQVTLAGTGLGGVTMAMSGAVTASISGDNSGNYAFSGLPAGGAYTITASRSGYAFVPASMTFTNLAATQTANFSATANTYSISGKVTAAGGAALSGASLFLSGSQSGSTTADSAGNYAFAALPGGGNYTITPVYLGYSFVPPSVTFNGLGSSQTANFAGTANPYSIAGQVTVGGAPVSGVTIALAGSSSGTQTTDAAGGYSFTSLAPNGNYTITPSRAGYSFAPPSAVINTLTGVQTANFAASALSLSITGKVSVGGLGLNGATVTLSGSQSGITTTDSSGNFTFTGLTAGGNYSVALVYLGYTFMPSSTPFGNLTSSQAANFSGTANLYTISGQVAVAGVGLSGVATTLSGSQSGSAVTDGSGSYSFGSLAAVGNYTITPSRGGYTFSPPSATFNSNLANQIANFSATALPSASQLSTTKTHSGNFTQGQSSAAYTVTVTNASGAGPTSGTITVTDTLPGALTLVSMAGNGWNCSANTCFRADSLLAGASYPSIVVAVSVASNAPSTVTNTVSVSGGGSATASADDVATVIPTGTSHNPAVVSLLPVAGAGLNQTFTFQFADPDGSSDLNVVNVLINTFLDGRHGCYIAYSKPSNTVYLVNDAGDAGGPYAGAVVLNGLGGAAANSQCTITGAGSTAVASGNTLTLALNITFSPLFGGHKVLHLAARDLVANNSDWQTMGVYGIMPLPSTFPNPVDMTPSSGSTSNATVVFTYQDAATAQFLQTSWVLVNTALDGRSACYVAYSRPANRLYLVPDSGDGSQATSIVFTGTNTISNSQCTISAQGSSVTLNGTQLILALNMTFQPVFTGPKGVWMAVQTNGGAQTSPWQAMGAWRIP